MKACFQIAECSLSSAKIIKKMIRCAIEMFFLDMNVSDNEMDKKMENI